jgi:hypothetical protein
MMIGNDSRVGPVYAAKATVLMRLGIMPIGSTGFGRAAIALWVTRVQQAVSVRIRCFMIWLMII